MIAPAEVIAQARTWVGVPFLHQGRTRDGCDCLGFIAACMEELGSSTLMDHLPLNYARDPQALLVDGLNEISREIPLEPGALILFQFPQTAYPSHEAVVTGWPSHAAIYTGESMIHSHEPNGKVVEHGYRGPWIKYTKGFWALPLVTYS